MTKLNPLNQNAWNATNKMWSRTMMTSVTNNRSIHFSSSGKSKRIKRSKGKSRLNKRHDATLLNEISAFERQSISLKMCLAS